MRPLFDPVFAREIAGCSLWKLLRKQGCVISEIKMRGQSKKLELASLTKGEPIDTRQAHAESRILYEADDGFIVASPMTGRALEWWATGTMWDLVWLESLCKEAPFIVISMPMHGKTEKFGLWFNEAKVIFVTETGQYVPRDLLVEFWPRFEPLVLCALTQNSGMLFHVPREFLTLELCLAAVRRDGLTLQDVPGEFQTAELCHDAVGQNGLALQEVPEDLRTPQLCELAVSGDGRALEYVPEALRTKDICMAALAHNREVMKFVPKTLRGSLQSVIGTYVPNWIGHALLIGMQEALEQSAQSNAKEDRTLK
jgi:Domain of unknown function (DUF4116)